LPLIKSSEAIAALGSASKMTAGELAVALVGSCKNLAGKLKSIESERAALLQSVDMHRSENRRLLEVPSLPRHHTFIQLTKTFFPPCFARRSRLC
jgi:hypothetical protein